MKTLGVLALCGVIAGCASTPPSATRLEVLRAEVTATERAFARTMADRDFPAFTRFLSSDSVFFNGNTPLVGPAAIAAAWRPLYEGKEAPFSWDPSSVVVLQGGKLALSSGAVRGPDGAVIGQFNSVWRRQSSGTWTVIIDKGCNACPCAAR